MTAASNPKKTKPNKRRMARIYAMQALYQWQFTLQDPELLLEDFLFEEGVQPESVDMSYFQTLVLGTLSHVKSLDALMTPHLDRDIARLNPVELSTLRMAVFELVYCKEVPYAVVINEAIELVKEYGSVDGYKFVNGVLDALAPSLRELEHRTR